MKTGANARIDLMLMHGIWYAPIRQFPAQIIAPNLNSVRTALRQAEAVSQMHVTVRP